MDLLLVENFVRNLVDPFRSYALYAIFDEVIDKVTDKVARNHSFAFNVSRLPLFRWSLACELSERGFEFHQMHGGDRGMGVRTQDDINECAGMADQDPIHAL